MDSIPIAELAGVGQSAVLCLNRVGINSVADLLRANPDEVAYLLDSFEEAERVMRAARKCAAAADPATDPPALPAADADAPHPWSPNHTIPPPVVAMPTARAVSKDGADEIGAHEGADHDPGDLELGDLGAALSLVVDEVGSSGPGLGLCERLSAVAIVLEHGGSAPEAIAAALHDAVLCPGWSISAAEARKRFGDQVGDLVAACARIQGVPLSPMGRPQSIYAEMVAHLDPAARRICAAQALAAVRLARSLGVREGAAVWSRFHGGRDFCLWYYRALATALDAAGSTPLTRDLLASIERLAGGGGISAAAA